MANRINTDELNESLIIASVRKNKTIVPANNPVEVVRDTEPETALDNDQPKQLEQPEQEQPEQAQPKQLYQPEQVQPEQAQPEIIPVATESPKTSSSEPPKEEIRRKRKSPDYESLFIRESNITARLGKTVYIRKEYHDRILKIIQVIGANEVSLFSYIDNIIAHHFEMFQDDISQSYKQRISPDIF